MCVERTPVEIFKNSQRGIEFSNGRKYSLFLFSPVKMRADEEGLSAVYSPRREPPELSVGWNALSPIHGRTPGPSVVQEGRLSLEMFTQSSKNEGGPHSGLTSVEKILRPKGLRRHVELTKVDVHRGECRGHTPSPFLSPFSL